MSWFNFEGVSNLEEEIFKLKMRRGKDIRLYDESDPSYLKIIENWTPIPIELTPELQKKMKKITEKELLNPYGVSYVEKRERKQRKYTSPNVAKYKNVLEALSNRKQRTPIPNYIKMAILEERGKTCENCRENDFDEYHHINEDPTDHRPENIELLCYRCHKNSHRKRF